MRRCFKCGMFGSFKVEIQKTAKTTTTYSCASCLSALENYKIIVEK